MSGLPLIADMRRTDLDVGFVPNADKPRMEPRFRER